MSETEYWWRLEYNGNLGPLGWYYTVGKDLAEIASGFAWIEQRAMKKIHRSVDNDKAGDTRIFKSGVIK